MRGFVFRKHELQRLDGFMALGYIYFFRSGKTDFFKIGKTYNLKDRLRQVQNGNPELVTVFAYIKTNKIDALENLFHYDAESTRKRGEWFIFHPLDLLDTLEYFASEKLAMDYTKHIYEPDGYEEIVVEVDVDELKKEYDFVD